MIAKSKIILLLSAAMLAMAGCSASSDSTTSGSTTTSGGSSGGSSGSTGSSGSGSGSGSSGATATGPDLTIHLDKVENIDYSTTRIYYTVTNSGDTDAGSFTVMGWQDWVDTNPPNLSSAQSGHFWTHTSGLAAGQSEAGVVEVASVSVTPGTDHTAYVIADYFNDVAESNEDLTGSTDNLSGLAWTALGLFSVNDGITDVMYNDNGTTSNASGFYDSATSKSKFELQYNCSASCNYSISFQLNDSGFTAGSYSVTGGTLTMSTVLNGVSYGPAYSSADSTVTVSTSGVVGDPIQASYDITLCPSSSLAGGNCTVSTTHYTGNIYLARGADQ